MAPPMSKALWKAIIIFMFLSTGSLNTLAAKWANTMTAVGDDGDKMEFRHSFLQTWGMFLGECLCLITFLLLNLCTAKPTVDPVPSRSRRSRSSMKTRNKVRRKTRIKWSASRSAPTGFSFRPCSTCSPHPPCTSAWPWPRPRGKVLTVLNLYFFNVSKYFKLKVLQTKSLFETLSYYVHIVPKVPLTMIFCT